MGKRILPRRLAEGQNGVDCENKKGERDEKGKELGGGEKEVFEAGFKDGFIGGGHKKRAGLTESQRPSGGLGEGGEDAGLAG